MDTIVYDGSFEGLLAAVFEIYEYRMIQPRIISSGAVTSSLFGSVHYTATDHDKAGRVYAKLKQKLPASVFAQLYKAYLSGEAYVEELIFRFISYIMKENASAYNYADPDVLRIQQLSKKVDREKHRMKAFIRFSLSADGIYYAIIEPDFNVFPLIIDHFENRYSDQRFIIYDSVRRYGIFYDLEKTTEITMNFDIDLRSENSLLKISDTQEGLYQQLWHTYYKSVNIPARKNKALHIRHVPVRYWRHLTEKRYGAHC